MEADIIIDPKETSGPEEETYDTGKLEDWNTEGLLSDIQKIQAQIAKAPPHIATGLKANLAARINRKTPKPIQKPTNKTQRAVDTAKQMVRKSAGESMKNGFVETPGFYYHRRQMIFQVGGANNRLFLSAAKGTNLTFFDLGLDEDAPMIEGNVKQNILHTNWLRPDKSQIFADIFVIEAIGWTASGIQIAYPDLGDFAGAPGLLDGSSLVTDDSAVLVPPHFFHDVTREELVTELIRKASTVSFVWQKPRTGGNVSDTKIQVGRASDIPVNDFKGVVPTSGGDPVIRKFLSTPGYVWAFLRGQHPLGLGDFHVELMVDQSLVFPFQGVDLGGGTPVRPSLVAVNLELILVGTAFKDPKQTDKTL